MLIQDANGIPLCKVCPECVGEKLKGYRPGENKMKYRAKFIVTMDFDEKPDVAYVEKGIGYALQQLVDAGEVTSIDDEASFLAFYVDQVEDE